MTLDPNIILKGLKCCSHNNPDCDNCPYMKNSSKCRELELDASKLIYSLLNRNEYLEDMLKEMTGDGKDS